MSVLDDLRNAVDEVFYIIGAAEPVTRKRITRSFNDDDDVQESSSDKSIYAVIQVITLEDANEFGGVLKVGDAWGFFEHNADVQLGDQIVHNGINYEVDQLFDERSGTGTAFKQAYLKRVKY